MAAPNAENLFLLYKISRRSSGKDTFLKKILLEPLSQAVHCASLDLLCKAVLLYALI